MQAKQHAPVCTVQNSVSRVLSNTTHTHTHSDYRMEEEQNALMWEGRSQPYGTYSEYSQMALLDWTALCPEVRIRGKTLRVRSVQVSHASHCAHAGYLRPYCVNLLCRATLDDNLMREYRQRADPLLKNIVGPLLVFLDRNGEFKAEYGNPPVRTVQCKTFIQRQCYKCSVCSHSLQAFAEELREMTVRATTAPASPSESDDEYTGHATVKCAVRSRSSQAFI